VPRAAVREAEALCALLRATLGGPDSAAYFSPHKPPTTKPLSREHVREFMKVVQCAGSQTGGVGRRGARQCAEWNPQVRELLHPKKGSGESFGHGPINAHVIQRICILLIYHSGLQNASTYSASDQALSGSASRIPYVFLCFAYGRALDDYGWMSIASAAQIFPDASAFVIVTDRKTTLPIALLDSTNKIKVVRDHIANSIA
jgi:hypothetical protein